MMRHTQGDGTWHPHSDPQAGDRPGGMAAQLEQLGFDRIDSNADGVIDRKEFVQALATAGPVDMHGMQNKGGDMALKLAQRFNLPYDEIRQRATSHQIP